METIMMLRVADMHSTRSGKRLGFAGHASSSARSNGGSSLWHGWSGAGQVCPSACFSGRLASRASRQPSSTGAWNFFGLVDGLNS